MIIDHISHLSSYRATHPLFPEAMDFLLRASESPLKPGRHEIDGDRIYALAMEAKGGGKPAAKLESHLKYIDIQCTVAGEDVMGWSHVRDCQVDDGGYQESRDVALYIDRPALWTTVRPGFFAVFFPQDAHAPLAGDRPVTKIVVKVAVKP